MSDFFFCRIFISSDVTTDELLQELALIFGASQSGFSFIETELFSISVERNKIHDSKREKEFPDGFLYFPIAIGIDFDNDGCKELAIETVAKILVYLWYTKAVAAVAACDYEEQLPLNGGYRSTEIPWPSWS